MWNGDPSMAESVGAMRAASKLLLTFVFVLLLALGLLVVVYYAGIGLVLLGFIPILVVLIYLLPGHGEASPMAEVRPCPRCGGRAERVVGTTSWRCVACGNVEPGK